MTASTATAKYAEALGHDIAAALNAAPHPGSVAVRYDQAAEAWAVRVSVGRHKFDLTMPRPRCHVRPVPQRHLARLGGLTPEVVAEIADMETTIMQFRDRLAELVENGEP
jgi:hypothetical protein